MFATLTERADVSRLGGILDEALQGHGITVEEAKFILSMDCPPKELFEAAFEIRISNLGKEIRFYHPLPRFPSISITGYRCSLNCKHCCGMYLRQMEAVESPEELKSLCERLDRRGAIGCLVSGGSDSRGSVPLQNFYGVLRLVKEETSLIVNVHTGLVDEGLAKGIAETGIDIASLDIVGSEGTIKRVMGINSQPKDYFKSFRLLIEAGVPIVVPHICIGLDWGKVRGEAKALWMLRTLKPEVIVILALRPTRGTPMESVPPPIPDTIAKMVAVARLMFPRASIALGCVRPQDGRSEAEGLTIMAGVDRITLPSPRTIGISEKMGLHPLHMDACCALPKSLEGRALRSFSLRD